MPEARKKIVVNKFPLRLMPSVRRVAEDFSKKEGVSLNQFINLAVAEKLARLQHDEWLAGRLQPSADAIAKALFTLNRPSDAVAEDIDRLPEGYLTVQSRYADKR